AESPLDDSPATGDDTDILLWTAFGLVSLAGMAALVTAKKKEN
ncbi:MAG: LPXTG cell wall anchor domain-containing protein, partial [Oscillospiraceae bacterium]|nr:LPXTG cell wall anchor domain-containing protein [Oscillospiraceae bacterium]